MTMLSGVIVISALVALVTGDLCKPGKADVMFVLSTHDSMDSAEYHKKLDLVKSFVSQVDIGANDVQVGIITEYNYADLEFHMSDHLDKVELQQAIDFTYFQGGPPMFGSGLEYIQKYGMDTTLGGRPGVPDVVVFLTDGLPADIALAEENARLLTDSGVTVMAIGADGSLALRDLIPASSGCHYVSKAPGLDSVSTITNAVVRLTCDAIDGVPADYCDCGLTDGEAEIIFLLDATSVQGKDNFTHQLDYIRAISKELEIGMNASRVAAVTYSRHQHAQFDLNKHINSSDLDIALSFIPYQSGMSRNPEDGLLYLDNSGLDLARDDVETIVVVTSTGLLAQPAAATAAANNLKNDGVTIISVGIGPTDPQEQLAMASGSEYAKHYANFNELATSADDVAKLICQKKADQATPPTTAPQPCSTNPCYNGGVCQSVSNGAAFVCTCPPQYTGPACHTIVPTGLPTTTALACVFDPCYNGGTCVVVGDQYLCQCPSGWNGVTCSEASPTSACPTFDANRFGCDPAEVIFMVEYGAADGEFELDHQGDWMKDLVAQWNMGDTGVRVGVVAYHDTVAELIGLDDFANNSYALRSQINSVMRNLNGTGTPDLAPALDFVQQNAFANARPGVPRVVIPVIHQMTKVNLDEIPKAGDRLKNDCVTLYGVTVDHPSLNNAIIQQMVSQPYQDHYYSNPTFRAMELAGNFITASC